MSEEKNINLLDYLLVLLKWKRFIIIFMFCSLVIIYLLIRFTIKEQFDAYSVIVPSEENSLGGLSGLLGSLDPFSIGLGPSSGEMGMYNTIIYSRSSLEEIIRKFDIYRKYDVDTTGVEYKVKTIEMLSKSITTEMTDDGAFVISVRSIGAQLSADISNYLIELMNRRIIELRAKKSRLNREFLGERLAEIRYNLKSAEDSLKEFQEKTGILSAEEQVKSMLRVYSDLEVNLMTKKLELSIMENIYSENSAEVEGLKMQVNEFEKQYNKLKNQGVDNSMLVPVEELPEHAITYFRLLRDIEINQQILQFVVPLYEQARFDEQKDTPVMQVIDYAEAPPKKSYPPRVLLTLAINIGIFVFLTLYIFFKENTVIQESPKYQFFRKNLFNFKSVEYKPEK